MQNFVRLHLAIVIALLFLSSLCGELFALGNPVPAQFNCQDSPVIEAARRNSGDLKKALAAGELCFHSEQWHESAYWLSRAYKLSDADQRIGSELVIAEMRSGELQAAEDHLNQMLSRGDSPELHSLHGELLEAGGHYSDAAHEYYRAAQVKPTENNIFDLANFFLRHRKYFGYLAESVKFFRYGVSKFPKSAKMRVGLGVALYASQEYDEAIKVLCQAVDLAPDDPKPVTFLGMARRVSPKLAKEVDQRLKEFAQRYPQNPAANYEYAMSLWDGSGDGDKRNVSKIESLLDKAIQEAPQWFEPHYELGILYQSEGKYRNAIREMRKACTLEPDFKAAHFHLSVLYARTGDQQEARVEAEKARQLDNREIEAEMLQKDAK